MKNILAFLLYPIAFLMIVPGIIALIIIHVVAFVKGQKKIELPFFWLFLIVLNAQIFIDAVAYVSSAIFKGYSLGKIKSDIIKYSDEVEKIFDKRETEPNGTD